MMQMQQFRENTGLREILRVFKPLAAVSAGPARPLPRGLAGKVLSAPIAPAV